MKEIITTGKTIEEAKLKAVEELNVSADDVTYEILDMPKDGFLGIGAKPARILVRYEDPAEAEEKRHKKEAEISRHKEKMSKPAKQFNAKEEKADTDSESVDNEKSEKTEKVEKSEKTSYAARPELKHEDIFKDEPDEGFVPNENAEPFLDNYLKGLFEAMNFDVSYTITRNGKYIYIDLKGETSGVLIGKRGDTLDAIQHITQMAINKAVHGGEKIRVDTEGYREKRTKTLVSLAKSIANRVIKSRGKYELEPMKAYERKIIHAALQSYPMLTTYSVGVEPERRLVVAFKSKNTQKEEE